MRSFFAVFRHVSAPAAGAALLSCLLGAFVIGDAVGAANTPPAVTPDNGFVQRAALQQHREIFTVANPGTAPATFTLEAFCRTSQVDTCVPSTPSLTLAAGGSAAVSISYSTGLPGGRLISEIGNPGVRGNRGRIRTMLEVQARAENAELQRDADIMGCRLATDPGMWANKC